MFKAKTLVLATLYSKRYCTANIHVQLSETSRSVTFSVISVKEMGCWCFILKHVKYTRARCGYGGGLVEVEGMDVRSIYHR